MEKHRRNNIADMTITEQLEAIKDCICDDYCKFRQASYERYKDTDDADKWVLENFCEFCPFTKL